MSVKKDIFIGITLGLILGLLFLWFVSKAGATAVDKITWCHVEPNGNQETLHLPPSALQNAGHMDANGNPLHAGDHPGECIDPTPTNTPTPKISCTPTPTKGVTCEGQECITPTTIPTDTPTQQITPTAPPSNQTDGKSDGRSDGRSDGHVSTPQPPKAPNTGFGPCHYPDSCGWK